MGQITDNAKAVYSAGPTSNPDSPNKTEIVGLFGVVEGAVSSLVDGMVIGGAVVYSTRAALYADLAHLAGKIGVVYNDGTAAYNGVYVKSGGSGSGSWAITSLALPSTFSVELAGKQPLATNLTSLAAETDDGFFVKAGGGPGSVKTLTTAETQAALALPSNTNTALDGKQPLATNLTNLASVTTEGVVFKTGDGVGDMEARPLVQSDVTNLVNDLAGKQPLSTNLTDVAAETDSGFFVKTGGGEGSVQARPIVVADVTSVPTDRLVGRDTAGTGTAESIALTNGLAFTGSSQIGLADMPQATFKGRVAGGGTGAPTDLTAAQAKTALALEQVNNTSDANKPVSTAQQTALDGKQPLATNLTDIAAETDTGFFYKAGGGPGGTSAKSIPQSKELIKLAPIEVETYPEIDGNFGLVYIDEDGWIFDRRVDENYTPLLAPLEVISYPEIEGDYGIVYIDADGWIYDYLNADFERPGSLPSGGVVPGYDFDSEDGTAITDDPDVVLGFIAWGQSVAEGHSPRVTTTALDPGYSFMFNSGPNPNGAGGSSLVDMVETGSNQTIMSTMLHRIQTALQGAIGRKHPMFGCIAAVGGQQYRFIKRGSANWLDLLEMVKTAFDLFAAQGQRLAIVGVPILHGESDFNASADSRIYAEAMRQFGRDIDLDIRAITGQPEPVMCFPYQTAWSNLTYAIYHRKLTTEAQLAMEDRSHNFRCVGPMYHVPVADTIHPTGAGQAVTGEQFGDIILAELFQRPKRCLRSIEAYFFDADTIHVVYPRAVAIDTSGTVVDVSTLGTGRGFLFAEYPGGPVHEPTSIVIRSGTTDTIQVNLPTGVAATSFAPHLYYASRMTGTDDELPTGDLGAVGSGPLNGPRGAVRESASYYTSVTGPSLYHWAAVEMWALRR